MKKRDFKDLLYEHVSRIGKALGSPKRLEIMDALAQAEKTVEMLANELSIDVKLTSAHLKALKEARLVTARREGTYMIYRLSGTDVAKLCVALRQVAEEHLLELRTTLQQMAANPNKLCQINRETLLEQARRGDVIVIDVRPEKEYLTAHLPFARSMPVAEIEQRLAELPLDREIIAYCRGPFCLFSDEAISLLSSRGYRATKILDGVSEWQAAGFALDSGHP